MDGLSREYEFKTPYPNYLYSNSSENPNVLTHAFHAVGVR